MKRPLLLPFVDPFATKEARAVLGPDALARFIPGGSSLGFTVPSRWVVTRRFLSCRGAGIAETFRGALAAAVAEGGAA